MATETPPSGLALVQAARWLKEAAEGIGLSGPPPEGGEEAGRPPRPEEVERIRRLWERYQSVSAAAGAERL